MAKNRLEILAKTETFVVTPEKSAFRLELQYGLDGQPTELVIVGLYWKNGAWAYASNQFRVHCTFNVIKAINDGMKLVYEKSKTIEKKSKNGPVEDILKGMTDEQKAALIAQLLGDSKAPKAPAKTNDELVLTSAITKCGRPSKK